ncbi:hypothetical protein [Nocardioides conyzicola]|uniref:DUF5666 domain-containing protein n=1 Tax=Nocardioides conyzicola TaxID=1651781 RepID=A0ABP8Y7K0_9ACTN
MNLTRVTLATASSVLVLATLAACGSDASGEASDSAAAAGGPAGQTAGGQGGRAPGASGEVAAVSGTTAQVQSQASGQVAVSWTGKTTFTQQVDATLADVTVGSCVVVTTADDGSSGDASTAPATEVTAATVRITAASDDGTCGFGGGGQRPAGAPSGMPTDRPSGAPSGAPSGGPGGGGRGFGGFGTVGEVTAVSATGFTVTATQPGGGESADATSTEVSVTVGDDTTYTTNAKATAAAVKVGACVNALGESDDTGAVAATSISVSQPVDGACTGGFGMGRAGGAS